MSEAGSDADPCDLSTFELSQCYRSSWSVREERAAGACWSYLASWECGGAGKGRCGAEGRVTACEPAVGADSRRRTVHVALQRCRGPGLLVCVQEEWQVTVLETRAGRAQYSERTDRRCGLLGRALLTDCTQGALRAARRRRLQTLVAELAHLAHPDTAT